jgi:hypothetical protein
MTIPIMTYVDGQGGNISINGIVLQNVRYRLRKEHRNQNVTTTGCLGNIARVRVIHDWGFEAHTFFDSANPPLGVTLTNGVWVWNGFEASGSYTQGTAGVPCIFQIGAAQLIYTGNALVNTCPPTINAEGVVEMDITGEAAWGPLVGPITGSIS